MGQRLVALGGKDPAFQLTCAIDAPTSSELGRDAGELAGIGPVGVKIESGISAPVDVIIDFSIPSVVVPLARNCAAKKIPLVIATTGMDASQREELQQISQGIPLLVAPSMSLAVNLTMKLVREAARALKGVGSGVDVEIIEKHHRYKEDAPSGTALRFGQIVASEMGQTEQIHGREGRPGHRKATEIGYHAVRIGDNVGEHSILFGMLGETIELTVKSSTRDSYAYGALEAAKFLAGKPPGLYSMNDVLQLG